MSHRSQKNQDQQKGVEISISLNRLHVSFPIRDANLTVRKGTGTNLLCLTYVEGVSYILDVSVLKTEWVKQ